MGYRRMSIHFRPGGNTSRRHTASELGRRQSPALKLAAIGKPVAVRGNFGRPRRLAILLGPSLEALGVICMLAGRAAHLSIRPPTWRGWRVAGAGWSGCGLRKREEKSTRYLAAASRGFGVGYDHRIREGCGWRERRRGRSWWC